MVVALCRILHLGSDAADDQKVSRRVRHRYAVISPAQRVFGVVMVLIVIDVVLLAALSNGEPPLPGIDIGVVVLGAAFAFVEWRVIHVQFRAEASSFSLFEVPLVLGLLYTAPGPLLVAAIAGVTIGLLIGRRQPPIKVAFNAANLGVFAGTAALIVTLAPFGDSERSVWLSILIAVVIGSAVSFAQIVLIVTLTEGFPGWRRSAELLSFGLLVSVSNTTIGIMAGIVLAKDVVAVLLLAVPAFVLFMAFRLITSEREQRERIEFLYRSTRRLDIGASEAGLITLLQEAREMFRAEIGAVLLREDDKFRIVSSAAAGEHSYLMTKDVAGVTEALTAFGEPTIMSRDDEGTVADLVEGVGGRDAMVAKLRAEDRDLGLLVVANRLGEVTSFTESDLQVLGALARQSAILMHSDRLEQALTDLRQLERELAYQASHDSLTGLPNRSVFTEALHIAAGSSKNYTLLFVDLDGFKAINDNHGHASGDAVLVEVGRRLNNLVRPGDTVSRFGGDEFAILLIDMDQPDVVANRIVASLGEPILIPQGEATIGCSIGLVAGGAERDPESLLRLADAAMYQAKESGKGRVVEHDASQTSRTPINTSGPGVAIQLDQLELHYQPIVDITRKRIAGVEALVRWRHPEQGLLLPGQFLSEAERAGLLADIDRWVLAQGTRELVDIWTYDPDVFLSVNLAPDHLVNESIGKLLASPDLDEARGRLLIEWPEEVLVDVFDRSTMTLAAIRDAGASVAIDRFGDGRASLGYLQRLDINVMKLGRRMADRLVGLDENVPLVQGIINTAHALGMRVVADGVEHPEQLAALQTTACDMAQGFLFARPMKIADLRPLIQQVATAPQPTPTTTNRLT